MPTISKVKESIVFLSGKEKYKEGQYYLLSKNTKGLVLSASLNEAKLLIVGDPSEIKINSSAKLLKQDSSIFLYENQFGKIINPFGDIIFPISSEKTYKKELIGKGNISLNSPKILEREKLLDPLDTGILSIDTMIPIGKGQRELIIGDRKTGKTSIALSTIINQRNSSTKVLYIAIGQKRNSIISIYDKLKKYGSLDNTIIMFANPDSSSQQFLAPKIGMAMAEILAYKGEDVLIVIDDLTKHANVYREISLSLGNNPGRESFPTDIFYQHASLLEKAGKFSEKYNGGSITCLPIAETIQGDIASLIPSNIISITDGQIFTSTQMFNNGEFPAIDIQLSVSRTGSSVQSMSIKNVSKNLKGNYVKLYDIKKFSEMSVDISENLSKEIERWRGLNNILLQHGYDGYSREEIVILVEMYKAGAMGRLKDPKSFSIIFRNFLKSDLAAKIIVNKITKGVIKDEELKHAIKFLFTPLAKTASGYSGDLFSIVELEKMKGVK